ncbi:hemerythrin domain-containing protein [Streptomyces sp. 7-21]|uniref:hemerythrin domain-containing protein n=1 Tax=Streptomyces sp. 7-21 TaxID=2802283 RepID=UPI00191EFABC|nr:hemerythrin domain-containing protein [Streptomyces sp. 7-21]
MHEWFREYLAAARKELAALLSGGRCEPDVTRQPLRRCREFCHYLHGHHAAEDARMCPALERERPDLAAVCARRREHTVVAALPDERNALLDAAGEQEPADSATHQGRVRPAGRRAGGASRVRRGAPGAAPHGGAPEPGGQSDS